MTFESPPVVEVIAGVSFAAYGTEMGALLSAFWKERLRGRFPRLEQQPPYAPPLEQHSNEARAPLFNIDMSSVFPWVRLWASSSDGNEVLQLQPGWFACNWRKVKPEHEYDRWPSRRAAFSTAFSELSDYLATEGVEHLSIQQCEVTYVNHIFASDLWTSHSQISAIFGQLVQPIENLILEQAAVQAQFSLVGKDGSRIGRLHTKITPALGQDGQSLYVFELTARGAPSVDELEGVLEFLDSGREAIDRAFVNMTTDEMHHEWGIQS